MAILLIQAGGKKETIPPGLQGDNGAVECVHNLAAALKISRERHFDAVVLDLRRGSLDPEMAVRDLRTQDRMAVIVVLAGQYPLAQRMRLLELGADDCLHDAVADKELGMRLRVLLRRTSLLAQKLSAGDLELDAVRRQVTRQGRRIALTPREFAVLECLLRNAGRPVSRGRIFEEVWNREGATTNIVDVYINYLRAKVDRDFEPKLIRTVYGLGYLLASAQEHVA